ncbi:methionyl-tRNA formyltransferase [Candidatus Purcelliella pentastirinorum]|uniref:Methionyl-tRNA formyltransferase n=1 Tax=Candidatus Purcelliella pentastirinorum TaxID=472834 RepID=A0AAX3N9G8_9ENTR|nr:methionyl-tRNA formyltransferase [Candidatus Purcelliella pentastirinorum]WDI78585.1 methionyl-tRNA formyltransferase [Candidatus Purcelliella pentastirinorum]WDR80387.1 methionyl-tRNA formyltransferase [Candidatus Purcelliella pentastirinorum]
MKKKLKILFFGTSRFALYHLKTLIKNKYNIIGIFTKLNKRFNKEYYSKIKIINKKYNIPIYSPKSIKELNNIKKIYYFDIDLIITVSYGLIIPKKILKIPKINSINIHASLLPKWRGAAPIQRSIQNGDNKSGISIIQMNDKLDEGDILYKKTCKIKKKDNSESLTKKLMKLGSKSMLKIIKKIKNKKIIPIKQNNLKATYAYKIKKKEAKINWHKNSKEIERNIRAFNPWPVCYFKLNKIKIKLWKANILEKKNNKKSFKKGQIISINKNGIKIILNDGILNLKVIQIPGKKKMEIKNLILSNKKWFKIGDILN